MLYEVITVLYPVGLHGNDGTVDRFYFAVYLFHFLYRLSVRGNAVHEFFSVTVQAFRLVVDRGADLGFHLRESLGFPRRIVAVKEFHAGLVEPSASLVLVLEGKLCSEYLENEAEHVLLPIP